MIHLVVGRRCYPVFLHKFAFENLNFAFRTANQQDDDDDDQQHDQQPKDIQGSIYESL